MEIKTVREKLREGHYQNQLKYDDNPAAYHGNDGYLTRRLMKDLFEEHGVTTHPKAAKAWALAWEHGHASGYAEVVYYFEEFVELIK